MDYFVTKTYFELNDIYFIDCRSSENIIMLNFHVLFGPPPNPNTIARALSESMNLSMMIKKKLFYKKKVFLKFSPLKITPQTCNFIKKRLQPSCLHVNIAKFLRAPNLKNICERLLLNDFRAVISLFINRKFFEVIIRLLLVSSEIL